MSIKRIPIIVSLFLIVLLVPKQVSAHLLTTDHAIGAVLHITPEDDPIAGEQAGFFFELKDKTGKFLPSACTCSFVVSQAGKEIFRVPAFQEDIKPSTNVFFTFPSRDVYQLRLIGNPNTPNAFQPFVLSWDIHVSRVAEANIPQSALMTWFRQHVVHVLGILIIFGFFVATVIADVRKRRQQKGK